MESLGLQMSWLRNTERSEMWLFGIEYADVLNELLLARVENWCEHGGHGGKQAQWFILIHSRVIYFDPEVRVSCLVWNHWVCRCVEWEVPKEARCGCLALSTQMFWMNYCLLEWRNWWWTWWTWRQASKQASNEASKQASNEASKQARKQARKQESKKARTQARRHAGTQARRHAGTQARRHAGTQARRRAGAQARRHAGTQAWQAWQAGTHAGTHSCTHARTQASKQARMHARTHASKQASTVVSSWLFVAKRDEK